MEALLKAKNDACEPYDVTIKIVNNRLSTSCTCPEGAKGTICTHVVGILTAEIETLVDDSDPERFALVMRIIGSVNYPRLKRNVLMTVTELKREGRLELARNIESGFARAGRRYMGDLEKCTHKLN